MSRPSLWEDLAWRGLVHQITAPELKDKLDYDYLTAYIGFDPTADSLHIGSLLQLTNMRRLQLAGHRVLGLVGGGTGLVGDPSGRDEERVLLDSGTLERNTAAIRAQIEKFFDGPGQGLGSLSLVDNSTWLREVRLTEFLRDIGKHFSVNEMIRKDSVRSRLEGREQGISYTEFSYMLLQAYDFLHLYDNYECTLQLGGSDQWGNIIEGIDLIRRLRQDQAYGLTSPLVMAPSGAKFGKTAAGDQIWLDANRTSPYAFYQYWVRSDDRDVSMYLRSFTFLDRPTIETLERATIERPEKREAQIALARHMTGLVHGEAEMERAERAAGALFTEDIASLDEDLLLQVFAEARSATIARTDLDGDGWPIADALAAAGLVKSKGEGRRLAEQGGVYVNNQKVSPDRTLTLKDLIHDRYVVLRKGKRDHALLRAG